MYDSADVAAAGLGGGSELSEYVSAGECVYVPSRLVDYDVGPSGDDAWDVDVEAAELPPGAAECGVQ